MYLGDIIVANFIGEKGAIDRAGTYAIFNVMPTKCSPLSPLERVTRKILPYPVSGAFAMLNSLQCSASQGLLPTNPFYLPVSKNSRCNTLSLCVRQRDDRRRAAQLYRGRTPIPSFRKEASSSWRTAPCVPHHRNSDNERWSTLVNSRRSRYGGQAHQA